MQSKAGETIAGDTENVHMCQNVHLVRIDSDL